MGVQLVIPMAGRGSRFAEAGYPKSKPLLEIHGVPMFQIVLSNLLTPQVTRVVIVAQKSWGISELVEELSSSANVKIDLLEIDYVTPGPASTVLLAESLLDEAQPVVVANSDQFIDMDISDFYDGLTRDGISGAVLTMLDSDPKWSYVRLDDQGYVVETREKKVISPNATVGIYGFSKVRFALSAIKKMISAEAMENGEYYVGPAFNFLDREIGRVLNVSLGPVGTKMHGLGIPVDFEKFLESKLSLEAAKAAQKIFSQNDAEI